MSKNKIIGLYDLLRHTYCGTSVRLYDENDSLMFVGEVQECIKFVDSNYENTAWFEVYEIAALDNSDIMIKVYDRRKQK